MKKRRAKPTQPNSKLRPTIIAVLALITGLVLLAQVGALRPLRIVTDQLLSPIRLVTSGMARGVSNQLGFLGSITTLGGKSKRLETEVMQLKQQLASMREISQENELLRAQLGFKDRQSLQLRPARVIGFAPDNVRRFLTIDVGKTSGVKNGMAVVSNGALVGTIDEAFDYSSRVFLLSDTEFRIRALGQDLRAQGIVSGQIGTGYSMEKIAQGETISRGETVVTTGSDIIPKGLIIGTVESVERSDNAVFQTANIRPALNIPALELVFVVTGQK